METTMFIFILIATAYFYKKRDVIPFAVFLGLILWTRPDGVAFIAALILDYLILYKFSGKDKSTVLFTKQQLIKILIISGAITILYFALNLSLSGSLLPNTYNAKLTYYAPEFRPRAEFLQEEVWQYFTSGAYVYIMIGFVIGFIFTLKNIFKGKYDQNILYIIFILLLIFIYWYKLPYAHRFGRYMMPIIPFFVLVAASGFKEAAMLIASFLKSKQVVIFVLSLAGLVILFFSINDIAESRKMYADECKYIYDRQVKAALWINEHSAETDVVATHDVGAIAFYTQRKIIDVAGLVTPELITKLNEKDYSKYMTNYLKEKNVKYLAFLREWYRVTNQNPLFSTANKLPPEIMEVYEFIPDKTMILSGEMKSMLMYAENMIMQKQIKNALQALTKGASIEPKASVVYFYLGAAYMTAGDNVNAEKNFLKALEIFPEYNDALVQTGFFYKNTGKKEEARKYFERYLKLYPDDKEVQGLYKSVLD
jgi:tetratricopeptide (TPR) repeat protein